MTDIYTLHDKAFARVQAFVIVRNGQRVATIAFKFPADGAGRLYTYVHWLGVPMVRGYAGGYGYDKLTAACVTAVHAMPGPMVRRGKPTFYQTTDPMADNYVTPESAPHYDAFRYALAADRGLTWVSALREAGFAVWQAV